MNKTNRTGSKTKVQYKIPRELGKGKKSQQALEDERPFSHIETDLPMINSEEMLLRVNQFKFVQKDIRATPDDKAWGEAVIGFQRVVRQRINDLIKEAGQAVSRENIFPFRLRFLVNIQRVRALMVFEPEQQVRTDKQFETILLDAINRIREKLASLETENKMRSYNIMIVIQTIEYVYDRETLVTL